MNLKAGNVLIHLYGEEAIVSSALDSSESVLIINILFLWRQVFFCECHCKFF